MEGFLATLVREQILCLPQVSVTGDDVVGEFEAAHAKFDLAGGRISRIEMRPVSPLADFSFDYKDLNFAPAP